MPEGEGELSQALSQGEKNAPIVKETAERRRQMRSYFRSECKRLGLIQTFPQPENETSSRVLGSEIGKANTAGLKENKIKDDFTDTDMNAYDRVAGATETKWKIAPENYIDRDFTDALGLNFRSVSEKLTARYAGYFQREDNSRAQAPGDNVEFNEQFLGMPWPETQRVISHELQHVKTFDDMVRWQDEGEGRPQEELYLWTFHEDFDDLYQRMSVFYHTKKQEGYPFGKGFERPTWENRDNVMNYVQYNELLSLLRGYEVYAKQRQELLDSGASEPEIDEKLAIQPYEFIEAFREEDLRFLDPEYRSVAAQNTLKDNPDLQRRVEKLNTPSVQDEVIEIDLEE